MLDLVAELLLALCPALLTNDPNLCYGRAGHVEMLSCFGLDETVRDRDLQVRQGHGAGLDQIHEVGRVQVIGDAVKLK